MGQVGPLHGITDLELNPEGIAQLSSMAARSVGTGKLVDPSRLAHTFVNLRKRAKKTFELLQLPPSCSRGTAKSTVTYTEGIREWDYGRL
jgi:probable phosphoglycerate mutase